MCYAVPVAGAVVSSVLWSRTKSIKTWWLTLMFLGASLFGVIDHLWNGELFLISGDLSKDLLLGVVISMFVLLFWAGAIIYGKRSALFPGNVKN